MDDEVEREKKVLCVRQELKLSILGYYNFLAGNYRPPSAGQKPPVRLIRFQPDHLLFKLEMTSTC